MILTLILAAAIAEPVHPAYVNLCAALDVYRVMIDWHPIEPGGSLRKGDRGTRVVQLRARLGRGATSDLFDDDLDAAVRNVQLHLGLEDDGIVGRKTLAELNIPREQRVRQIESNLERWRHLPPELGARYLLVNVPAFQLDLVEAGRAALSMKIVAGREYTATPSFTATVQRVILNPPWNVPPGIASKELWPKQERDPSYFARERIHVTVHGLRQDPGPWCALGRIKFDMPNPYNVYLHDTPAKSLFSADVRAFSHGCIRLEKPIELAEALTGWPAVQIQSVIDEGHEVTIPLNGAVPVYVVYWTAFVAEDGHVEFRRDVYHRDPMP